jgi:hypothetical protein
MESYRAALDEQCGMTATTQTSAITEMFIDTIASVQCAF